MESTDKYNIYDDAAAYDLIHCKRMDDLPFYLNQLTEGGKSVLELGCGTGRLTIPLALEGFDVTGIDIAESMLVRGREKAAQRGANIDWVHGDVRDFDLSKQFDTVLFPANSLSHLLDNQSIEACLACVRRHLTDDGRFIFQMFNPGCQVLTRDPNQRFPVAEYEDPAGRGHVTVTESNTYNSALQINNITWYYLFEDTQEEIAKSLPLRMIFPQELDYLLRHNSFDIIAKYGGFDGNLFTTHPFHQIPVCQKHRT